MLSTDLGRDLFVHRCNSKTTKTELFHVFTGLCQGNVFLLFRDINQLNSPSRSLFIQLSSLLYQSILEKKSSFTCQSRQIAIVDPNEVYSFVSIAPSTRDFCSKLSSDFLIDYRLVTLSKPDMSQVLLAHFIQAGFTNAQELAKTFLNLLSFTLQIPSQGSLLVCILLIYPRQTIAT
jgi:hypothetical protein